MWHNPDRKDDYKKKCGPFVKRTLHLGPSTDDYIFEYYSSESDSSSHLIQEELFSRAVVLFSHRN